MTLVFVLKTIEGPLSLEALDLHPMHKNSSATFLPQRLLCTNFIRALHVETFPRGVPKSNENIPLILNIIPHYSPNILVQFARKILEREKIHAIANFAFCLCKWLDQGPNWY